MEISVIFTTFNHEKFIRQAIESVFSQKIDVPFEMLLCDDASSDKTFEIIKEYKKITNIKMAVFTRKHNSNHPTKNIYYLISKAKGKYLAFLEGDDYWVDYHKLKKQYGFMESNPEYSACVGDIICVDEEGLDLKRNAKEMYPHCIDGAYSFDDFRTGLAPGHHSSLFMRNSFGKQYKILYTANNVMADYTLLMLNLIDGKIFQMPDKLSAWRIVVKDEKLNFNSIHIGNKYRTYIGACYFIRLENFIRAYYYNDFEFTFILDWLINMCCDIPLKSYFKLIKISTDKWRYMKFVLFMCILSGYHILEFMKDKIGYSSGIKINKLKRKQIVIFGAGEYARKYLDRNGWREQVLFIVDNDVNKQNKSFKGYLIKKPEDILSVKDKVTVLIANRFNARDIAEQLESMGVKDYCIYNEMNEFGSLLMEKIMRV